MKIKYGRLILIKRTGTTKGSTLWLCKCRCGNNLITELGSLRRGDTKSCGCLQKELASQGLLKHGEAKNGNVSKEYNSWRSMISRCLNPNSPDYKYYGGRGIKIYSLWRYNYKQFLLDMGRRPSLKYTLERINTNGNYEPNNCKWATAKQQANNRRNKRSKS